jgi:hypothetical protein
MTGSCQRFLPDHALHLQVSGVGKGLDWDRANPHRSE